MAVGIKQIAEKTGLSTATVSLALNGSPLVNKNTRELVVQTAEDMGYKPNPYARKLVRQKSGLLGVVVPDIENIFYATLVRHLNTYSQAAGYDLSIFISQNDRETEARIFDAMREAQVEGILYVPINIPGFDDSHIARMQDIPMVCTTTRHGTLPFVMSNLQEGMEIITGHMVAQGCQWLAHVTGPEGVFTLDERDRGFHRTLIDMGMPDGESFHMERVTYGCACGAAAEIAAAGKWDGVVCVNDIMALGVINTFQQLGVRVPQDILVSGFDGSIFSVTSPVPITTVVQDVQSIARVSIQRLLGKMQENILIPTELIIKKSTIRR